MHIDLAMDLVRGVLAQVPTLPPTLPPSIPTTVPSAAPTIPIPFLFVGGFVFAAIGGYIWNNKGGSMWVGILVGFLFGLIGVIVLAIIRPSGTRKVDQWTPSAQQATFENAPGSQSQQWAMTRPCPNCGQQMQADLGSCPTCKQASAPWRQTGGMWIMKDDAGHEWWLDPQANNWRLARSNKFCPRCLAELQPEITACPECGEESRLISAF